MVRLSDLQLATLLDEIASAMRADQPLVESLRRLEQRPPRSLSRAVSSITAALERGQHLSAAVAQIDSPLAAGAAAAIESCTRGGQGDLLNQMAEQLRQRNEFQRQSLLAWFYPMLLICVGYAVIALVMAPMVRRHQGTGIDWPAAIVAIADWLQTYALIPGLLLAVAIILMLVWRFQSNRLPANTRRQLFCSSLASQLKHNVVEEEAIGSAAVISGDSMLGSISPRTLSAAPIQQLLSEAAEIGDLPSVSQQSILVAKFRYLANLYQQRARRHTILWTRLVPRLVMILVGGGIVLGTVVFVIGPIYQQVAKW